jgi:hypothetical protein
MNWCAHTNLRVTKRSSAALLFSLVVLAVSLLCLVFPLRVSFAADAKTQSDLESAEQGLVNLDYEAANKMAERVVRQKGLSHEQLVRAYRVLALTHAVLDHENPAREAFQYLLTIDPDYAGDPNLGPKVQAPFLEARGFIRAQAVRPGIEVGVSLHPGEAGSLRVTTRDPTHIAKRVSVGWRWGSEGAYTVSNVPPADGQVVPVSPAPPGSSRLDYYAMALDDRDGAVFEVGNPNVPKSATVEAPSRVAGGGAGAAGGEQTESRSVFASPVFWIVTSVILIGGGVTAGVLVSQKKGETQTVTTPPTSATLLPGLQCGQVKCN